MHGVDVVDAATGKLILSDCGTTIVRTRWIYRKVTWTIDYPKVKSFLIVGKTAYNPFEDPIPVDFDTEVRLKVKKPQPPLDWEYSIHWKDKDNKITISDPKISIDPSTSVSKFFLILGVAATFLLSLFGISWLLHKKKSGR